MRAILNAPQKNQENLLFRINQKIWSCLFHRCLGAAIIHSFGTRDEVSLPAKFKLEVSASTEKATAVRKFRPSPANYCIVFLEPYSALAPNLLFEAHVKYNKVITGNEFDF